MNPYVQLIRPGVCGLPVISLIIAGIVADTASFSIIFISALISAFLLCASGNVINDYFDMEIDRINAPKKPIPSVKIARKKALYFYFILAILSLALASLVSVYFLGIVALTLFLASLYPLKLKKIPFVKNVVISLTGAFAFIAGGLITGININLGLWLLFSIAFFVTLGREMIKDIEDIKGDSAVKVRTLPIIIGSSASKAVSYIFILIGCGLLFLPAFLDIFSTMYFAGAIPAIVLCILSIFNGPHKARVMIKFAMYLALLGFVLGTLWQV